MTFPNRQFILSTHSPLVISDYKEVLCYSLNYGELFPIDDLFVLNKPSINRSNGY